MCGIFGIWKRDGSALDLASVASAAQRIRHRGPDDEGFLLVNTASGRMIPCGGVDTRVELGLPSIQSYYNDHFDLALAFRRLSILDLSPAGHQPMASSDGQVWIIFNGEIYNYIELRTELTACGYTFRSGTDTEVILAAYQAWGVDSLTRFNGMWSMAIWDNRKRTLFLSRDRFGIKPMVMARASDTGGNTFAFGSEIKTLVGKNAIIPFDPEPNAIYSYLAYGRLPDPAQSATFFRGVESLPAGHHVIITPDNVRIEPYYQLRVESDTNHSASDMNAALEQLDELFTDAVRIHLRADVPIGTCLSGGVDSSSIVAHVSRLMQDEHGISSAQIGDHQKTFSAVYNDDAPYNERKYIDQVVAHTGASPNYIIPNIERLIADHERMTWHQDEPFTSTSIFAQWCVMDLAHRSGITVMLDGQGADEQLAGYRPFAPYLSDVMHQRGVSGVMREARAIQSVTGEPALRVALPLIEQQLRPYRGLWSAARAAALPLKRYLMGSSASASLSQTEALLRSDFRQTGRAALQQPFETLDAYSAWAMRSSLPDLLRYEDRNSMAFSIEARVPFLDVRLVEFLARTAAPWRIHEGWTKWLFRKSVSDKLPAEIVWRRDKIGFETPEIGWMTPLSAAARDRFHDQSPVAEYGDMPKVRALLSTPSTTSADARLRWRWINLETWLRLNREGYAA